MALKLRFRHLAARSHHSAIGPLAGVQPAVQIGPMATRTERGMFGIRPCAIILCTFCLLALVPASLFSYAGTGWLDLPWPGGASAAAMVFGPLPLAFGAFFAWKAARDLSRANLLKGVAAASLSVPLYFVVWVWGGRMLI